MRRDQIPLLFEELLREVQKIAPGVICQYHNDNPADYFNAVRMGVGHEVVEIRIRCDFGFGPATLKITGDAYYNHHVFRETKKGWFVLPNVAKMILAKASESAKAKAERQRSIQLKASANQAVKRISENTYPRGFELSASWEKPGTITAVIKDLNEQEALQILRYTQEVLAERVPQTATIWDQIRKEDDL